MPLFSFEGKSPKVHPSAFVAPTAVLVGDVTIEENASVWYNAVLRADFAPIVVRRGANVQDCAVVHVTPAHAVEIGAGATVGHTCVVHGATLGEEALVGNGVTVPFALAAGLTGAVDTTWIIVVAGLAEIAAGSIAMGLGGYLAARSDAEHYASERAREQREVREIPADEAAEVIEVLQQYGL